MSFEMVFSLVGGTGLLLFGLRILSENLDNLTGARFRSFLGRVTKSRFLGLGTGAAIASLLQSSSAATLLLVGLARTKIINLSQAVYLILGSDIGSTVTIQLIAFKIFNYALLLIGAGFFISFLTRKEKLRNFGLALMGLGLVYLGLKIMIEGMAPLKDLPWAQHLLEKVVDYPLLGILLGALFTSLLNSSTASIGIYLAASAHNLLPINAAIPLVLGANLGTCTTVLISSIGGPLEAKRIALAHFLIKAAGVLVFLPFLVPFRWLMESWTFDAGRQIANAHTFFNAVIAVLFFPFSRPLASMIASLIPAAEEVEETYPRPRYIDAGLLDTPSVALSQAAREVLRMAEFVREMYQKTLKVFVENDLELAEWIEKKDDWVDTLDREIKFFLTRLSQKTLSPEESVRKVALLSMINDLENIGDIIDKNLLELARKKILKDLRFSDAGMAEIIDLHEMIGKNYDRMVQAVESQDLSIAEAVLREKPVISQKERALHQAHISRLDHGFKESIETSSIHLDVLTNLKRINSHITGIAYSLLELKAESS